MKNACGPDFDSVSLCARIGVGDRDAEAEFAGYFERRIRVFLAGRTKDRRLIDEVCQDILMAVLCALREGRVREPKTLSSFVYGVARNHFNDCLRQRAREKLESFPEGLDVPVAAADHEEQQRYQAVASEIEKLEHADREILSMTLVDGMKPGEIASKLELTSEVVRQRKSRALRKLISRLGFGSHSRNSVPLIHLNK